MSTTKESSPDADDASVKHTDLTRGLEPPWSWVQQFAAVPQSEKSYNFVESDTTPADGTPNLLTDGSFDFCTGHFKEDASDFDGSTFTSDGKTDDTDEQFKYFEKFVGEIIVGIGIAIDEGKCELKDIQSVMSVMSGQRFDGREKDMQIINDTLQKADENKAQFGNLNDLGDYLKEEGAKFCVEPLSRKLLECDIQIDDNVVTKVVPDDMILGLVESNSEPIEKEAAIRPRTPASMSPDERNENIRMVDGFITDAIDEIPDKDDDEAEENVLPTFNCDMPALPGIGKACSPKIMDAFLVYILSQARDEKGMVYPRLLNEPNCPIMMNSLN